MKVGLIIASSKSFSPYLNRYVNYLEHCNIDYTIIQWDRLHTENPNKYTYKDNKEKIKRSFFDYKNYKLFINEILLESSFDKIVVFGIQLTFLLRNNLKRNFKNKYIIDIRDYHPLVKLKSTKLVILNSEKAVISSPMFISWLPYGINYIVSHNLPSQLNAINFNNEIKKYKKKPIKSKHLINISYVGSLRDYKIQKNLILNLKNNNKFIISYHGQGTINDKLNNLIELKKIKNVNITDKYSQKEENKLYYDADLINMILPKNDINSKTLLPNRLYRSINMGIPVLSISGSYTAEIIEKYSIGIVIESFDNLDGIIQDYFKDWDENLFLDNCSIFLEKIKEDEETFFFELKNFIV